MLTYSKLAKKPKQFRSFTGLEAEEFDKLFGFVSREYPEYERERLERKGRERAIGAGRPFKLELRDRLLMLLVYYRQYMSYALAGYLFDLDLSNVCRDIRQLEPLVKRCIPLPKKVHNRAKKIGTIEELLTYYPELKAILDATEQEIPRPKNRRRRKSYYSGKKKRHTVKTQLIVNRKGLIVDKRGPFRGRKHDYRIFKDTHPRIPPDVEIEADSGYQGIQDDFPGIRSRIPVKKQRGRKLGEKARKRNRKLSKSRVVVEHVLSKMKKFGIMGQEFRNGLGHYGDMTDIVSGLVNFRTMLKEGMDVSAFVG